MSPRNWSKWRGRRLVGDVLIIASPPRAPCSSRLQWQCWDRGRGAASRGSGPMWRGARGKGLESGSVPPPLRSNALDAAARGHRTRQWVNFVVYSVGATMRHCASSPQRPQSGELPTLRRRAGARRRKDVLAVGCRCSWLSRCPVLG
jgi:hypothetical protein